jgi:hemolysin activation/secretion protein
MKPRLAWALLGLGLASPLGAQAPAVTDIQADRAQAPVIDRDRSDRVVPSLPAAPRVSIPRPALNVTASAAAVNLDRVRFAGSSLPLDTLEAITTSYRGQALTQEVLRAIVETIGKVYARSDIAFYSVAIPVQRLEQGVLTVQIVEGAVTQYSIKGLPDDAATDLVKAHVARIMRSTPLRKSVLERSLSLMRDMPGQTVEAAVRQLDATGSLALDLTLKRRSFHLGIAIDNNGVSNVTTALQAQATVTVNNAFREGDTTKVSSYLPLHPDRYQFYTITHSTPVASNGMTATVTAARLKSRSRNATLGDIDGRATLAGISLSYPVIRSYKTNLSVSASLDGIDSSNYYLDTRFGDYKSRAIRLGASLSRSTEKRGYAVTAVVSRGIDILDAKAFAGFSQKDFTKVNVQTVAVNAISKNLVAKLSTNAQFTRDKLPVTERLALGGIGAGRAFRVGTVTADRGATGMAELSWTLPLPKSKLKGTALFAFVDGGVGRNEARPLYGIAVEKFSLASAGGGVRLQLGKVRAGIEVAIPIDRPGRGFSRKARLFGSLGSSF